MITNFSNDFPTAGEAGGKKSKIFQNQAGRAGKFPKFTTGTTTTGRPLGRPIFNAVIDTTK